MSQPVLDSNVWDAIFLGTSFTQSIVASAMARVGKRVLQIDSSESYGGDTTTLHLLHFNQWLKEHAGPELDEKSSLSIDEGFLMHFRELADDTNNVYDYIAPLSRPSSSSSSSSSSPSSVVLPGPCMASDGFFGASSFTPGKIVALNPSRGGEGEQKEKEKTQEQEQDAAQAGSNQATESTDSTSASSSSSSSSSSASIGDSFFVPHEMFSEEELFEIFPRPRQYWVDLSPHLLFARGAVVELLVQSDVAKYLEFKPVDDVYLHLGLNGSGEKEKEKEAVVKVTRVPLSKADVFQSDDISMLEKRALMKMMVAVLGDPRDKEANSKDVAQIQEWSARPFVDYLTQARRLSPKLAQFVLYAIARVEGAQTPDSPDLVSTAQGIECVRRFLHSIGRFSSGAFLYPMYGISELAQAFSRCCAVFGGIQLLRFPPQCLVLAPSSSPAASSSASSSSSSSASSSSSSSSSPSPSSSSASSSTSASSHPIGLISAGGQYLHSPVLCCDPAFVPTAIAQPTSSTIVSRAVVLVEGTLCTPSSPSTAPSLFSLPPGRLGNKTVVHGLQFSSDLSVTTPSHILVYLWTVSSSSASSASEGSSASSSSSPASSAQAELLPLCESLFDCRPRLVGGSHKETKEEADEAKKPKLLWAGFYQQRVRQFDSLSSSSSSSASTTDNSDNETKQSPACSTSSSSPCKLFVCSEPPLDIGLEGCIQQARELFERMCPGQPFHPPQAKGDADDLDALSDDEDEKHAAQRDDEEYDEELARVLAESLKDVQPQPQPQSQSQQSQQPQEQKEASEVTQPDQAAASTTTTAAADSETSQE